MSVISATSISCRTMADGSLRIVAEVSTIDAQAAFALFGLPGQPMALAALTQEAAKDTAQQAVIKQSASVGGDDSKDSL